MNAPLPVLLWLDRLLRLNEVGVSFSKGDEITVTGSKAKHQGSDVILGREVVKGNDTLVMRDDKGEPVWSWRASK